MAPGEEVAHYGLGFARPLRLLEGPDGAPLRPSHGFRKAPSADIRRAPFSCSLREAVEPVEHNVEIPTGMQRAMAHQTEAARQRRAKVISAEGVYQASTKLGQAAAVISQNPIALQLRYLQTLLEISGTNNSTTILPVPIDLLRALGGKADSE